MTRQFTIGQPPEKGPGLESDLQQVPVGWGYILWRRFSALLSIIVFVVAGLLALSALSRHPASSPILEWTGLYRHVYVTQIQAVVAAVGLAILGLGLVGVNLMLTARLAERRQEERTRRERLEDKFVAERLAQQRRAMLQENALVMGPEVERFPLGPWTVKANAAARIMTDIDREMQRWLHAGGLSAAIVLRENTRKGESMTFNTLTVHIRGQPRAQSITVVLEFELLQVIPNLKADVRCYAAMRADGDVAQYRMGSADVPLQREWEETPVYSLSESISRSSGPNYSSSSSSSVNTKYTWSGIDDSLPIKEYYGSWRKAYGKCARDIDRIKEAIIHITASCAARYARQP